MQTVRVVHHKWPAQPHWEHDALLLGEDEHGTWLGAGAGTWMQRPGASFHTTWEQVTLVPDAAPFLASFYSPTGSVEVYVDITTHATWQGSTVHAVDLDLDVVRGWSGRVWVDDEDEFADHRVRFGYPDDVVALATASCADVHAAVAAGRPPFDGAAPARWLERLGALMMER